MEPAGERALEILEANPLDILLAIADARAKRSLYDLSVLSISIWKGGILFTGDSEFDAADRGDVTTDIGILRDGINGVGGGLDVAVGMLISVGTKCLKNKCCETARAVQNDREVKIFLINR